MRPAPGPALTVVVASISRPALTRRCLEALAPQRVGEAGVQVVVVRAEDLEPVPEISFDPEIVSAPPGASVFRLRSLGVARARGRLVALIEDHILPGSRWCEVLLKSHAEGRRVLGGPVAPAPGVDFALYACEYGWHAPPGSAGPVGSLSGVDIAYDRRLLEGYRALWRRELREDEIGDALRRGGIELYFEPRAVVESALEMSRAGAACHLFAGGRHYGLRRAAAVPPPGRWWHVARSPLVPALLFFRLAGRLVFRRPGWRWRFFVHTPGIVFLLAAWSLGEAFGAVDALAGRAAGVAETAAGEQEPPCA